MNINLKLSDSEFSDSDIGIIRANLGVKEDDVTEEIISKLAKCALLEYKKMFLDRGLPTKAAEVMQERLFYLIKGYFRPSLPTEQLVSTIFQLDSPGSKTLLRNTISKFRVSLKEEIITTIRHLLETARVDGDSVKIVIQSETIKDEINLYLTQYGPTLNKLMAVRGKAGLFGCTIDTYNFLRQAYELDPE